MTPGARQTWRAVAATVGACLLVMLVAWAALIGPSPVLTGPGPIMGTTASSPTDTPVNEIVPTAQADADEDEQGTPSKVVGRVIAVVLVLVIALGVLLMAFLGWRRAARAWRFRRRVERPAAVDFDTVDSGDPQQVRRVMASDAEEQLRLLLEGRPRNAIVACWHRFEVQAVEAGLARHPWETSSEFALRLLDRADIDPAPVSRLLELYREARFSEHDLDEEDRAAAVAALRDIQTRVSGRRQAERP